jgi:hypothetical protein
MMQQFVVFSVNPHTAQATTCMYPQYITYTSQRSKQGDFNSSQGGSSRDVVDAAAVVVAKAEAKEGDVEDADAPHTIQPLFLNNLSPNLEGHSRCSGLGQIQVELPLCLPGDMPQPEEDDVAQNTPTKISSTTTGTCVTHMGSMSRTGTGKQRVNIGRWTTRRASHAKTRRGTLMWDMLLAQRECIKMCC